MDYKQSVRVITTTNITLTGGAPVVVDGVTLKLNDRILVSGQSTGSQNGIYIVSVLGTGSNGTWIRSTDTNATGELESGTIVMVTEGSTHADTSWKLTTNDPIVIGTTALTFEINTGNAFGVISANGTSVVANSATGTVTFSTGNNIVITGNAATDTVTFAVRDNPTFWGNVNPGANVTYDLGNTTNRWRDIWLANSTIYLGNAQISANATAVIITNPAGGTTVLSGATPSVNANTIVATGNITGGNLITSGVLSVTGNANVGNLGAANANLTAITVSGNANVGNLGFGSGQLTGTGNISGGNLNLTGGIFDTGGVLILATTTAANVALAVNNSNVLIATTTGANITGTLNATGNANLGNLGATNAVLAGSLTGVTTISASGNANVGNLGATNANLTAITATGNANVGNLGTAGLIVATGNITGGNLVTAGQGSIGTTLSVTGNANVGNLGTAGQITATGNVTANNVNLSGNIVDTGPLSLITGASGNVSLAPNGTNVVVATTTGANITGTLNATGNANVGNLGTAGLITVTGNVNSGGFSTTGNISGAFFLGNVACASGIFTTKIFNGTTEANIGTSGGNANITIGGVSNIAVFSTAGANITGTLGVSGNITGGNLSGTLVTGTLTTAAQPNITSVGTLTSVSVTGNVSGGNLVTTGTVSTGTLTTSGNATIAGNLTVSGNVISVNVTNLNVVDPIIGIGRGANDTPLTTNDGKDRGEQLWYYTTAEQSAFIGYDNSAGKLIAATNVSVASEVVTVNSYGNLIVGGLESTTISATGNANVGNLGTAGQITATGNVTAGGISTAGNVTAAFFLGNVSQASGIFATKIFNGTSEANLVSSGGNLAITIGGTSNVMVVSAGGAAVTGTLTSSGNANVGNLGTAGQITATGNVTGGNVNLSGNIVDTGALTLITGASGNVTLAPNGTNVIIATTTGANITGTLNATGNANVGNLGTAGQITVTGNVTAVGNISGGNILGNGFNLSGISAFRTVAVTAGNSVVADSIADTLTFTAGSGITIIASPDTDTITIAAAAAGSDIFVDGADFGTVTETVTLQDDLGLITEALDAQVDLGEIVTSGVFYPNQLVLPSFTVSTLPSATIPAQIIYVSNATGGAITAFSDGTNWRRTSDRSVIN